MKNKIFAIFIIMLLSMPVGVQATSEVQEIAPSVLEEIQEPIDSMGTMNEQVVQQEESIKTDSSVIPHKEPLQKRKLLKLFLKAMFAVGISSLALYIGLTIYNKIRGNMTENSIIQNFSEANTSLSKPNTIEEAVKIFMDKTNWK